MEENKVENVINIIKDIDIKDKLRLGICLSTSSWINILWSKKLPTFTLQIHIIMIQ